MTFDQIYALITISLLAAPFIAILIVVAGLVIEAITTLGGSEAVVEAHRGQEEHV